MTDRERLVEMFTKIGVRFNTEIDYISISKDLDYVCFFFDVDGSLTEVKLDSFHYSD